MASDIEQNITPADLNSSLNVVPTETLSKTASTATFLFADCFSGISSITPASFFCSVNGIPSFEYVSRSFGSTSSKLFGFSFILAGRA